MAQRTSKRGFEVSSSESIGKGGDAQALEKHRSKSEYDPGYRVSTGVAGLDDILGGGFPPNSTILVTGGPGVGKTILCLQFLVKGALQGEPGIMISNH